MNSGTLILLGDGANGNRGASMQFILGVILFVGVLGVTDARLPWPPAKGGRA